MANYEADEQTPGDEYHGTRISTGSDYIDKAMRGGIPLGSVTLIEGPSASGKSVLCQHVVFGALMADLLVAYYTDNDDVKVVADNMISLGLDVSEDVESDQLRFFRLSQFGDWRSDPSLLFGPLRDHMRERIGEGVDLVVMDDFTAAVSRGDPRNSVGFVADCKTMSRRGLTVVATVHTSAFDKELIWRFHRLFDAHVSLSLEGKSQGYSNEMDVVNLLEVKKVANLAPTQNNTIYFRVNPELGASMNISLDVIPIFKVKI